MLELTGHTYERIRLVHFPVAPTQSAVSESTQPERRQGKTGVWTFVIKIDGGKILATSEWGTNYEFDEAQWKELPEIEESKA